MFGCEALIAVPSSLSDNVIKIALQSRGCHGDRISAEE